MKKKTLTDLEREELETYRMKSENGQIAAYYLLAEELGVPAGGSVVDTVHARIAELGRERDAYKKSYEIAILERDHWFDLAN